MEHEALSLQADAQVEIVVDADGVADSHSQDVALRRGVDARLPHRVVVEVVGAHEQRHACPQSRQSHRKVLRPLRSPHTPAQCNVLSVL